MIAVRVHAAPHIGALSALRRELGAIAVLACGLVLAACGGSGAPARSPGASTPGASTPGAQGSGPGGTPSAAASGSASGSNSPGPVSVCQTAQLKIAIGATGAIAGTSGGDLLFKNKGSAACQLVGWPTLVAVTAAGKSDVAVHARTTMFGPFGGVAGAATISPGATAGVAFTVGANNCARSYRTLRVTPPGNTREVVISAWLPQLDSYLPACAPVNVSPVVPLSALQNPVQQP